MSERSNGPDPYSGSNVNVGDMELVLKKIVKTSEVISSNEMILPNAVAKATLT